MDESELKALKSAVEKLSADSSLAYHPDLAFFKDFLLSWKATIPTADKPKEAAKEPEAAPAPAEEEEEEEEEPEEPEEEDPERLPEDPEPYPELGPEGEKELTDDQMDAQGAAKQAAVEALEDGKLEEALAKYTEAIKVGNATAMMYAKRAELLLKLKRPNACINDCSAAIKVNPDSGKAYRIRGKAHRLLGHWEEAQLDLATGQKLDYDDNTADVQKFVAERFKRINERKTRQRLRDEKKAEKRRQEDYKRRKEAANKAYQEAKAAESAGGGFPGGFPGGGFPGGFPGMPGGMGGMPGGMGGMPGGMGGMPGGMGGMPGMGGMDPSMFQGLLSDPELMSAFSNPKIQAAMCEIMSNPAAMSKYQNDPEIMAVFQKMMSKVGAPGAEGGAQMPTTSGPTVEEVPESGDANEVD